MSPSGFELPTFLRIRQVAAWRQPRWRLFRPDGVSKPEISLRDLIRN